MFSKVDSVNKFSNRAVSIISKNVKVLKKQKLLLDLIHRHHHHVNLIRHQLTVLTGANNAS